MGRTSDILDAIWARQVFRAAGHYEKADDMRRILEESGVYIQDTPEGVKFKDSDKVIFENFLREDIVNIPD